jgi:hypothetical protein
MPLSSLLPVGGAALGILAAKTLSSFSDGLSFKSHLAEKSNDKPDKAIGPEPPRVTVNLTEALPKFVSDLRDRLGRAGVDLSQPFVLKEDGQGGLIVEGDHPDRSTIERLLSDDPLLVSEFQAIAGAAVEQRQRLPLGNDNAFGEFRLAFADGRVAVRFE